MNLRLLEIQKERQEQMLVMQQALAHIAALDQEENEILTRTVRLEYEEPVEEETMPNFAIFSYKTSLLLTEMWEAPNRVLLYENIREDVIFNEDASEDAIKMVVLRARKEIEEYDIEIKNIHGKGYQLITNER